MVRPPDEPRRQVEGNPIRLDPRFRSGRSHPYREAAGNRGPHRVVGRSRSRRSRIRTEPINEVNRDNAVSRRIFQNMHIRNRSNNIEHNSMVYRSNIEQPSQPHNVRLTRNRPRRLGITNAEHQRSRPDAKDIATRQRAELRRLIESFAEPKKTSNGSEFSTRQQKTDGPDVPESKDRDPQPGTSSGFENLNDDPQPGTSSLTGSSVNSDASLRSGFWRPDLDVNSSSSEEDIAENDTKRNARKNPRRQNSNRGIAQDVKYDMRRQAEIRRKEARITRNRNLSESSTDSDGDVIMGTVIQEEKPDRNASREKTRRNHKRHHSVKDVEQEVTTNIRGQMEEVHKVADLDQTRNMEGCSIEIDSVIKTTSHAVKCSKHESYVKSCRSSKRRLHERDMVQEVRADMRVLAEMRRKNARCNELDRNLSDSNCGRRNEEERTAVSSTSDEASACAPLPSPIYVHGTPYTRGWHETLGPRPWSSSSEASSSSAKSTCGKSCNSLPSDNKFELNIKTANSQSTNNQITNSQPENCKITDSQNAYIVTTVSQTANSQPTDIQNSSTWTADNQVVIIQTSDSQTTDSKKIDNPTLKIQTRDGQATNNLTTESQTSNSQTTDNNFGDSQTTYSQTTFKQTTDSQPVTNNIKDGKIIESQTTVSQFTDIQTSDSQTANSQTGLNIQITHSQNESNQTEVNVGIDTEDGRILEGLHLVKSCSTEKVHCNKVSEGNSSDGNITRKVENGRRESKFACSSFRKAATKKIAVKWNKPPPDAEEKERQALLKEMKNVLYELLHEVHESSPIGQSPAEEWWVEIRYDEAGKCSTESEPIDEPFINTYDDVLAQEISEFCLQSNYTTGDISSIGPFTLTGKDDTKSENIDPQLLKNKSTETGLDNDGPRDDEINKMTIDQSLTPCQQNDNAIYGTSANSNNNNCNLRSYDSFTNVVNVAVDVQPIDSHVVDVKNATIASQRKDACMLNDDFIVVGKKEMRDVHGIDTCFLDNVTAFVRNNTWKIAYARNSCLLNEGHIVVGNSSMEIQTCMDNCLLNADAEDNRYKAQKAAYGEDSCLLNNDPIVVGNSQIETAESKYYCLPNNDDASIETCAMKLAYRKDDCMLDVDSKRVGNNSNKTIGTDIVRNNTLIIAYAGINCLLKSDYIAVGNSLLKSNHCIDNCLLNTYLKKEGNKTQKSAFGEDSCLLNNDPIVVGNNQIKIAESKYYLLNDVDASIRNNTVKFAYSKDDWMHNVDFIIVENKTTEATYIKDDYSCNVDPSCFIVNNIMKIASSKFDCLLDDDLFCDGNTTRIADNYEETRVRNVILIGNNTIQTAWGRNDNMLNNNQTNVVENNTKDAHAKELLNVYQLSDVQNNTIRIARSNDACLLNDDTIVVETKTARPEHRKDDCPLNNDPNAVNDYTLKKAHFTYDCLLNDDDMSVENIALKVAHYKDYSQLITDPLIVEKSTMKSKDSKEDFLFNDNPISIENNVSTARQSKNYCLLNDDYLSVENNSIGKAHVKDECLLNCNLISVGNNTMKNAHGKNDCLLNGDHVDVGNKTSDVTHGKSDFLIYHKPIRSLSFVEIYGIKRTHKDTCFLNVGKNTMRATKSEFVCLIDDNFSSVENNTMKGNNRRDASLLNEGFIFSEHYLLKIKHKKDYCLLHNDPIVVENNHLKTANLKDHSLVNDNYVSAENNKMKGEHNGHDYLLSDNPVRVGNNLMKCTDTDHQSLITDVTVDVGNSTIVTINWKFDYLPSNNCVNAGNIIIKDTNGKDDYLLNDKPANVGNNRMKEKHCKEVCPFNENHVIKQHNTKMTTC